MLENDEDDDTQLARDAIDLETSLKDAEASPVVTLVDRILLQAMSVNASDIHVEPQQKGLRLRFRQDGVLQQYVEPLPSRLVPAVTSRFKILADLDIAERRQAQDGRIRRKYRDRVIDFRVNTLPSRFGEKVCLRLLDSGATQLGLDKLISDPDALALVRDLGSKPFGMILVTGPTGSGKSTTLYSLLAERNDPGINISTVEDPIEYTLPGITQCQVNREKGFDFATALRAFMRQDPDVLLVGETRDLETAKTAIEAALTGHLVLSTLHANDAPSTIARLDEMGVEPFMVSRIPDRNHFPAAAAKGLLPLPRALPAGGTRNWAASGSWPAGKRMSPSTEPTITVPTNRSAPTARAAATRVVSASMKCCGSRTTWPQPSPEAPAPM